MESINSILANALDKYFNTLPVSGYIPYNDVQSLIVLIGIKDLLTHFSEYITNDDLHLITKALDCISDNCYIDIPNRYNEDASLFEQFKNVLTSRITEEEDLRVSETETLRSC